MKYVTVLAAAAAMVAACGCQEPISPSTDAWLIRSFRDDAINNAIVAEHTIYSYHFLPGSAKLNELGEHDLRVLAEHFKRFPGDLNVRRGEAPQELYQARLSAVALALGMAGVDTERMKLSDSLPGGDGMVSDEVIQKLQASKAPSGSTGYRPMVAGGVVSGGAKTE